MERELKIFAVLMGILSVVSAALGVRVAVEGYALNAAGYAGISMTTFLLAIYCLSIELKDKILEALKVKEP